jgi:putative membrane protein
VPPILNYAIHLFLAALLLIMFFAIYTRITPYDEVLLIRQGNAAAALSLGGSLIGFSLTIASSLVHTANYEQFFLWAFGAMAVQVLAYFVTSHMLKMSRDHIENGNVAYGGLLGAISISIGAINAACIS